MPKAASAATLSTSMKLHITSMPPNVHIKRNGEDLTRIAHVRDMHLGRMTIRTWNFWS